VVIFCRWRRSFAIAQLVSGFFSNSTFGRRVFICNRSGFCKFAVRELGVEKRLAILMEESLFSGIAVVAFGFFSTGLFARTG